MITLCVEENIEDMSDKTKAASADILDLLDISSRGKVGGFWGSSLWCSTKKIRLEEEKG